MAAQRILPAAAAAVPAPDQGHVLRTNIHSFPPLNLLSDLRIQLIETLAAGGPHIIVLAPFKNGDEKQAQTHISDVNPVASVAAAGPADIRAEASQFFLFLIDSTDKKHT